MSAYFQDVRSKVVIETKAPIDEKAFRLQTDDYVEVTEKEYVEYKFPIKQDGRKQKQ